MPENEQPDDYLHLPTAGDRADAAKRAKAELWQKVAEKRRSKIAAASAFAEPTPAEITAPEQPLHDDNDWADLLSLDPDAEHVPLPPMHLAAPAVIISTPVEVELAVTCLARSVPSFGGLCQRQQIQRSSQMS